MPQLLAVVDWLYMRDAPAGHSAMHLDALEVQPFDFGHELPLLGDCHLRADALHLLALSGDNA